MYSSSPVHGLISVSRLNGDCGPILFSDNNLIARCEASSRRIGARGDSAQKRWIDSEVFFALLEDEYDFLQQLTASVYILLFHHFSNFFPMNLPSLFGAF
jgi:hypothetical protein